MQLHRRDLLRPGSPFDWSLTRNDEPAAVIIKTEQAAILLIFCAGRHGSTEVILQRVPVLWTPCHFGGRRPWFRCEVCSNGRYCRRTVAALYYAGDLFACRHCCRLSYVSQQEPVRWRGLSRARKIRARLGTGPNVMAPLPAKPKGMHTRTYDRLCRIARSLRPEHRRQSRTAPRRPDGYSQAIGPRDHSFGGRGKQRGPAAPQPNRSCLVGYSGRV